MRTTGCLSVTLTLLATLVLAGKLGWVMLLILVIAANTILSALRLSLGGRG